MKFNFVSIASLVFSTSVFAQSSYENILRRFEDVQNTYSDHAEFFELGQDEQGEIIKGLKVSLDLNRNLNHLNRTNHVVVATIHGNEREAANLALQFTSDLLEALSSRSTANTALNEKKFFIFPVLNIDGYNRDTREQTTHSGEQIDPNRDYPDPCGPHKENYQLASSRLIADFLDVNNVVSAISIHGYIGSFTYPWGTNTDHTHSLDHDIFSRIAEQVVSHNNYEHGTSTDVIYPTIGAFEDWAYWEHGIWTTLIEMHKRANKANDSQSMLEYFRLVPTERSIRFSHNGTCRESLRFPFLSRP